MKYHLSSLVVAVALLGVPLTALAHEHQTYRISDKTFNIEVGSLNEPIFVDDRTGVFFQIAEAKGGQHAEEGEEGTEDPHNVEGAALGLEGSLKVEIGAGERKQVLDLLPIAGEPGSYQAPFIPTVQTTYTYRFFGKINEVPVDLTFTCSPVGHTLTEEDSSEVRVSDQGSRLYTKGVYGCPRARRDIGFPEAAASSFELKQQVEALSPQKGVDRGTIALGMSVIAIVLAAGAWFRPKR